MSDSDASLCEWISGRDAFKRFATYVGKTESAEHIKPLHWYIACRLVLEGGFEPDDVTPRPPFKLVRKAGRALLSYDPELGGTGERTVLGGLKTKNVDVVVTKDGIGPVVAVSCKSVKGAFRNLTNRMEETIGECTNLHITYPAMVMGYYAILRANRTIKGSTEILKPNDVAILDNGAVADGITRFHDALSLMTLRRGIRNEISRYEAMAIALIQPYGDEAGSVVRDFPADDSPLRAEGFFRTLYERYDERFVYGAPLLADRGVTRRNEWAPESPVFTHDDPNISSWPTLDFEPRLSSD